MIVIFLAVSSYYFSSLSVTEIKVDNIKRTQFALKQAKQALIAYAATYNDIKFSGEHGILPCPDYNNGVLAEGLEDNGNCGARGISKLGYLPWRTLRIQPLKDESGTCLMYAVTGEYKNDESATPTFKSLMLNEDSYGTFDIVREDSSIVTGGNPADRIVALVFAPGRPLPYQARTFTNGTLCGGEYAKFEQYLDTVGAIDNSSLTGNVADIDEFVHATSASELQYNDLFLTITREEIWQSILNRNDFEQKMENLSHAMAMCLATYANQTDNSSRRLPWPATTNLSGADYPEQNSYQDDNGATEGYSGRYPYNVSNSNNEIDPDPMSMTADELLNACDSVVISIPDPPGSLTVNLTATAPDMEYRELWNNWKDHFFYVLSSRYEPKNVASSSEVECGGSGECITVNGTEYAAAVIFSGRRLDSQSRNDKSLVSDYLEDGKADEFIEEAKVINRKGNRAYTYTDPQTESINDIMYCIEDKPVNDVLSVIECS